MNKKSYAVAKNYERCEIYYPENRPGYTAWASLFQFGNGDLGVAFNEIRQGKNPDFNAPSLEFVECMVLPYRMSSDIYPLANPDIIFEYVNLKSTDGGKSWEKTGQCTVGSRHFYHIGFPDGRLVRLEGVRQYRYELSPEDRICNIVEESTDGGNTWREISSFLDGKFFYGHKLKKLKSGAIIAAGPIELSLGPGGERFGRHSNISGEIKPLQSCFMISDDGGYTWDGPHYIFPGIMAWEPDFVELADGSLLFINSTVQAGRAVRQIVKKTATGWVNEPLMEIRRGIPENWEENRQGGFTPETVTISENGLIVGARRGGVYSCSNDFGENWYEIEGAPKCEYQPMIEYLGDNKFLTVWHEGGDTRFGEIDMFIGTDEFTLKENLPGATKLTLERELSEDKNQYINAFSAKLTADGKPVSGRELELRLRNLRLPQPDGKVNPVNVWDSPDIRRAATGEDGIAHFVLKDKENIMDVGHCYEVAVSFTPEPDDELIPCKGPAMMNRALTTRRGETAPHPAYLRWGTLMITPETAEHFPDLSEIVKHFDIPEPDTKIDQWVEAAGSEERAEEILDFLIESHIVIKDDDGVYHWHRGCLSGGEGEGWIHDVDVCKIEEYTV